MCAILPLLYDGISLLSPHPSSSLPLAGGITSRPPIAESPNRRIRYPRPAVPGLLPSRWYRPALTLTLFLTPERARAKIASPPAQPPFLLPLSAYLRPLCLDLGRPVPRPIHTSSQHPLPPPQAPLTRHPPSINNSHHNWAGLIHTRPHSNRPTSTPPSN